MARTRTAAVDEDDDYCGCLKPECSLCYGARAECRYCDKLASECNGSCVGSGVCTFNDW